MEVVKKIRQLPERELEEVRKITLKYPDRVPVIVDRLRTQDPKISKYKYLVPHDLCLSQLLYVVRKKIALTKAEDAIYMFCGDPETNKLRILSSASLMSELQKEFAGKDRFLIIYYSLETTFGKDG